MKNDIRNYAFLFLLVLVACFKNPNDSKFTNPCDTKSEFYLEPVESFPFYLYKDKNSTENHYVLDHVADPEPFKILINDASTNSPYRGSTCIEITWPTLEVSPDSYAHWYWLPSSNNIGDKNDCYNLSKAKRVVFYARGEVGGEKVAFGIGGLGFDTNPPRPFHDTVLQLTPVPFGEFPTQLTNTWKEISIETSLLEPSLCRVLSALSFKFERRWNPSSVTIYLDEIRYE